MANMNRLQTRIQKKDEKHQKTLELIAKLQAQAAEEEKQLQDDKMQLNSAWVKRLNAKPCGILDFAHTTHGLNP